MTLNERILDFLDGSLPPDDEAELLHTLSVSPEKRTMLRGFMEQHTLFTRDAQSLSVPYETEQRLWARMDRVLPVSTNEEPATVIVPVESSSMGFLARAFSGGTSSSIRAAFSAFTLITGIGIGYFAGHSTSVASSVPHYSAQPWSAYSAHKDIASSQETPSAPVSVFHRVHQTIAANSIVAADLSPTAVMPIQNISDEIIPAEPIGSDPPEPSITPVKNIKTPAVLLADIGGDGGGNPPILHHIRASREQSTSLLSRFEFRVDESFGRQFPNSIATNVSLPIITNSSITTFFQVLPHSNLFWAGASFGSANITRKDLFTQAGDPIDPSQDVLASDTSHAQTSYVAALAELRLPAFETADLTFTAGYGLATLGQMMFGEIGLHYDVSSQAGIQCGLRVLRFTYDLTAERNAAIASGNGSLAISNAVAASSPSFNTELNAGLFFHF
jgi:hypothetical protein